jgi:hypothetical protein
MTDHPIDDEPEDVDGETAPDEPIDGADDLPEARDGDLSDNEEQA